MYYRSAFRSTARLLKPTHRRSAFDAPLYMGSSTPNVVTAAQTIAELESAELTHVVPSRVSDHVAINSVKALRWFSDKVFRERYIHRSLMLIGIASAPPLAVSITEHFRSLWKGKPPSALRVAMGEAENHRMHYAVICEIAPPTIIDRIVMTILQIVQFFFFFVISAISPRLAHRMMGYLSEEATVMLTHMVNDIDVGKVIDVDAPALAVDYWGMQGNRSYVKEVIDQIASETNSEASGPTSAGDDRNGTPTQTASAPSTQAAASTNGEIRAPSLRDVVLLMRADEMIHRDTNHRIADAIDERNLAAGKGVAFKWK